MAGYIKLFPHCGVRKAFNVVRELDIRSPYNCTAVTLRFVCTAIECNKVDKITNENASTFTTQENELVTNNYEADHPLLPVVDKLYLDTIGPRIKPSLNLAAYANHSLILQKLVDLGVDLSEVEKKVDPSFLLKLDFKKDVKGHIIFLHSCDVLTNQLGSILTKSPQILQESLDDLNTRIRYLKLKKFTKKEITRLVTQVPSFLLLNTLKLDQRLGFIQKFFSLKSSEVRQVTVKFPKLLTCNLQSIRENDFCVKEQMGFSVEESKQLFLSAPKLWLLNRKGLLERFDIIHNCMAIPYEMILVFPKALFSRSFVLRQRHGYLAHLGRAQYDPKKPNYVSLEALVSGTDEEFCRTAAATCVEDFNEFLKSL